MSDDPTRIFTEEQVRRELLRDIRIPADLTNRALQKIADKLDATKVEHHTYKGRVVTTTEVEDHSAQLSAADKVLSMAGLYKKDAASTNPESFTALEIDPTTGVVRIVHGPRLPSHATPALPPSHKPLRTKHTGTQGVPEGVWSILDGKEEHSKRVIHDEEVD
jgi:hypothetical protein